MTKYRVVVRQDAWLNHTAVIEANTPQEAAEIAEHAWKDGDGTVKFEEDGYSEFDDILVDPEDCEEIDENGDPLREAQNVQA